MKTMTFETALGLFGVGWTERGLARVLLPDTSQKAMLERLERDGRGRVSRRGWLPG